MEQEEQPKSPWGDFLNAELAEALDELGGEKSPGRYDVKPTVEQSKTEPTQPRSVNVGFFLDNAKHKLYSFAYETKYNNEVRQHQPIGPSIVGAGGGNFPNITDLEGFVKDFTGQLEFRGFRPESPQKIDIGNENNRGVLFKHEYDLSKDTTAEAIDRVFKELTGILRYLQQKYI
ncbi:MAG: hypothetical protein IH934_07760 [Nanoarchaeota archaeon]|nr:hypothetical protein [Nanoarchaeota archaeon]